MIFNANDILLIFYISLIFSGIYIIIGVIRILFKMH